MIYAIFSIYQTKELVQMKNTTDTTLTLHAELVDILKQLTYVPNDLRLELIKFFGTSDLSVIDNYDAYYDVDSLGVYQIAALNSRLRWILCFAHIAKRKAKTLVNA